MCKLAYYFQRTLDRLLEIFPDMSSIDDDFRVS